MASIVDPHNNMRSRDISKVAKGQQAPRPPHEPPATVSAPPPPSSTITPEEEEQKQNQQEAAEMSRRCYSCYVEYLKCTKQKGEQASECNKLAHNYRSTCPPQWIKKWDEEKKHGIIHNHV